jgi:hypothetical protein
MDAYVLEIFRARPDPQDQNTRKRHASSLPSRSHTTDGSDDEEADTDGHARPRALPRTLPVLRGARQIFGQIR